MAETTRRADLFEWMKFCKEKIDPIEKVWNKRLEDADEEEPEDEEEDNDGVINIKKKSIQDEDDDNETQIANILSMANNRRQGVG